MRAYCGLDEVGKGLMNSAMRPLGLTARAYHRALKVARTISDLAESEGFTTTHLGEALQYRWREGGMMVRYAYNNNYTLYQGLIVSKR